LSDQERFTVKSVKRMKGDHADTGLWLLSVAHAGGRLHELHAFMVKSSDLAA
jgi:hypothetical protein